MDQYCAYENQGKGKQAYPFLINLQHPVANVLKHALFAPAMLLNQLPGGIPPAKVCPIVTICGQSCVVMVQMMAGIPVKELGECVADLQQERVALRNAVDFILSGY